MTETLLLGDSVQFIDLTSACYLIQIAVIDIVSKTVLN